MSVETPFSRILDAAYEGALILTVNKRLSRHLHALFDESMREKGRVVWNTPDILPLEAWWYRTAERFGLDAALLDRPQALRLWERIIDADLAGRGERLLQIPATAEKALEAHRLLEEYEVLFRPEEGAEDHLAFLRWRREWQEHCRTRGFLDPAQAARQVTATFKEGRLPPERVLLVGFDEVPPAAERLLAVLTAAGSRIDHFSPLREPTGKGSRVPCADPAEEIRTCARWAGRLLDEGAARIGVVVIGLERYAPLISRIFREELDPAAVGSDEAEEGLFNLSLGTPLAAEGMIAAALDLLAIEQRLSPEQIDFLLRSPFVGGARTEQHSRALLDRERRDAGFGPVRLDRLAQWARQGLGGIGCSPTLARVLTAFETTLEDRRPRLPGEWAGQFARMLAALGWPGEKKLDSRGYQVIRAWRELNAKFASLDGVSLPLDRRGALGLLRQLATREIFQLEGPPGRIQILGHLEAAGLHFDHLWLMGLTEEALPSPPRPNPFLPLPLQKRLGMPHAGAERELDFARKVAGRLMAAAPTFWASYPAHSEGTESRPSPFIRDLSVGAPALAPIRRPAVLIRSAPASVETLIDAQAPPLAQEENVSGGTELLKDQALCPFRAFARHRLAAASLPVPPLGIDARTRGIVVHAALDLFWERTGDSEALHRLGEEALGERIDQCLTDALADFERRQNVLLPAAWKTIELGCLRLLLEEWLALERRRAAFTVRERETRHREVVGGLAVRTRVDRIDELADGSRILLDYKTGRPKFRDCLGDRLLEPQLPLYAVGEQSGTLSGVAFAAVRRGECAFRGVSREESLLPAVSAIDGNRLATEAGIGSWEALLECWRNALDGLGAAFAAGRAAVDPVSAEKACAICDLQPFCRVAEAKDELNGEEGER